MSEAQVTRTMAGETWRTFQELLVILPCEVKLRAETSEEAEHAVLTFRRHVLSNVTGQFRDERGHLLTTTMAIISGFTLIRAISLFHITAAYFFLTAPKTIADQNAIFILGESMRLPHATSLDKPNDASAFIGVLLAFLGIVDLTAASMEEGIALHYWLSNVPVRLVFFFVLTAYTYLFKEGGALGPTSTSFGKASLGEPLQNSLVFSFGFVEIATWFWIFTSLREERREMARKRIEDLIAEEDRL
ncbi:hypothetical protein CLAFUW4_09771 [Fulvia fulva]|uniref:Increased loss of mitochondrial DNA protein 1 n=1 Tax=Passalora fulva TaxID=5499 RepID=A0A9Q8UUH7_PASFU|nr:uncharacterized protein CLAFUR5_12466 [Fulvia fulva]KAK4615600.1 hypothetical protein CLAFUR4_09776 [Fulvia fulva]KAK4616969.1 hypothetical protein CLAFUR0_09769 [Fulvia fulva]UJO22913.1 hypothetical protein CLAFUR5_12466 [Fulvia fulva]WPV19120.1 hypothetical protein CLAFUW4_09771 [Fulvia fulva]WPV34169.1 hypothetical protein CLAFUW7_09774 [Fulvia fulva]